MTMIMKSLIKWESKKIHSVISRYLMIVKARVVYSALLLFWLMCLCSWNEAWKGGRQLDEEQIGSGRKGDNDRRSVLRKRRRRSLIDKVFLAKSRNYHSCFVWLSAFGNYPTHFWHISNLDEANEWLYLLEPFMRTSTMINSHWIDSTHFCERGGSAFRRTFRQIEKAKKVPRWG